MRFRPFLPAATLLFVSGFGVISFAGEAKSKEPARPVSAEKELLITDLRVVNSRHAQYPGPWSFGTLMERLPVQGKSKAPAMIRNWLQGWMKPQTVNQVVVEPRPDILAKLILPWQKKDGYDPASGKEWEPNLAHAPFRLLAIVNRIDLAGLQLIQRLQNSQNGKERSVMEELVMGRETKNEESELPKEILEILPAPTPSLPTTGWGPGTSTAPLLASAEGRFVFCAIDETGAPLAGGFTVILEYPLSARVGLQTLPDWAAAWHDLSRFPEFGEAYLAALATLTDSFSSPPAGSQSQGGTIVRVRTSEKSFGPIREMREFSHQGSGEIVPALLAQTPRGVFGLESSRENSLLGEFLVRRGHQLATSRLPFPGGFSVRLTNKELQSLTEAQKRAAVRKGRDASAPLAVMAGSCDLPEQQPGFCWKFKPLRDKQMRRDFSMRTCNGCHCGETNTTDGLHIKPRNADEVAEVSAFLKPGKLVLNDPADKSQKVTYTELEDRIRVLEALLEEKDWRRDRALMKIASERSRRSH